MLRFALELHFLRRISSCWATIGSQFLDCRSWNLVCVKSDAGKWVVIDVLDQSKRFPSFHSFTTGCFPDATSTTWSTQKHLDVTVSYSSPVRLSLPYAGSACLASCCMLNASSWIHHWPIAARSQSGSDGTLYVTGGSSLPWTTDLSHFDSWSSCWHHRLNKLCMESASKLGSCWGCFICWRSFVGLAPCTFHQVVSRIVRCFWSAAFWDS